MHPSIDRGQWRHRSSCIQRRQRIQLSFILIRVKTGRIPVDIDVDVPLFIFSLYSCLTSPVAQLYYSFHLHTIEPVDSMVISLIYLPSIRVFRVVSFSLLSRYHIKPTLWTDWRERSDSDEKPKSSRKLHFHSRHKQQILTDISKAV